MYNSRAKIKNVKLVQEKETYYLDLTYECENDKEVYVLNIPRVELPYFDNPLINVVSHDDITLASGTISFYPGGIFTIKQNKNGTLFSKIVVKEKTHKMTVAEIEKKLGYKIEIVSDK